MAPIPMPFDGNTVSPGSSLSRDRDSHSRRISIHTLGTRGDLQPYLALAVGLKAAGHQVLIAAPSQYQALVGGHGIGFAHLPGEFLALMETPEAKAAMGGSAGFTAGFKMLSRFKPIARRQLTAEWRAAEQFQPELIIYHPKAIGAPHIAQKIGCPAVLASPLPGFTPTNAFASPMLPLRSVGPLNRKSHAVMASGGEFLFRTMIADWRVGELGLGKRSQSLRPAATLYAYSPSVLPRPSDWPPDVAVTGYWFLDDDPEWSPPDALQAFLAAGDQPVYIGFGSMPGIDPDGLTRTVLEAVKRSRSRAVIATGGGALQRQSGHGDDVCFIEGAPHAKLFPMMAACVHHGGAGTTGASLRAGKPTVICPFFGDQPFWGRLVHSLGAGPPPTQANTLTPDGLAHAIWKARFDPAYREVATRIGNAIAAEDGVANAVAYLARMGLLGVGRSKAPDATDDEGDRAILPGKV